MHFNERYKNSNANNNIEYCSKDGKFFEWGTLAQPGKRTDLD